MADLILKAKELEAYLEALQDGSEAIQQGENPPVDPDPLDSDTWKRSWRNKVVAGSSFKAAFYGTLTAGPTVTKNLLISLGLSATAANAIISERDFIRSKALALIQ